MALRACIDDEVRAGVPFYRALRRSAGSFRLALGGQGTDLGAHNLIIVYLGSKHCQERLAQLDDVNNGQRSSAGKKLRVCQCGQL